MSDSTGKIPQVEGPSAAESDEQPKTIMKKRYRFVDGELEEYWEAEVVQPAKKPAPKLNDFEEFKFDQDITIGSIFPSLLNTRFDAVTLKKTSLVYLGRDINKYKPAGLWFETDVEFRGILQPISDTMRDVFGVKEPAIHLSAHIGTGRAWDDSLVASGFTFNGSIQGVFADFGSLVQFRNIGIELSIKDVVSAELAWGFVGIVDLKVPNSVVPLVLQYDLVPDSESCRLSMGLKEDEAWNDVFGVSGFNLSQVSFTTSFTQKGLSKNLSFSVMAAFSLKGISIELEGRLDNDNAYLRGSAKNFTFQNVCDIFTSMTGQELQPVDQDIVIDEVTIEISKGRLRLFGAVSMNGHKAAEATITISTDGVCIIGTVDDITIGEDVVIKEASINIVIGSCSAEVSTGNTLEKGKGVAEKPIETPVKVPSTGAEKPESGGPLAKPETPTRTAAGLIKGIVKIKDITFLVALAAVKVDGKMEWVVYGEMNSKTLSIGELIGSGPDDEILNVALRRVTIVASSVDDPKIPELNVCGYPIKQGIQICAQLDTAPFVSKLTNNQNPTGKFMLMAGYSKEHGLKVMIQLPEDMRITLSDSVQSGPIILEIEMDPAPVIKFGASIVAKFDGQPKPFKFTLGLSADAIEAKGFATMEGYWENPLDLGSRIKLGPRLTLQVGIIYAVFFASGTPSGLGFEAGVVIDETKRYEAALWLSESIKDTFVKAHIAELDITDVIQIVNSLMEHNVPSPKDDVLRFEEIDLYASQGGCVLGNVEYPPGFVLQGTMFLCGKKAASVDCRIGKQGLKLYGEIPGFKVGPLTITGATGDNAIVDMEITKTRQHFEVNGKIVLWGISASILVIAELQPHPQFIFDFELAWSDLLKFKVYAEMIRGAEDTDLKNLENSDFVMRATMHQKILSAVADQMQHFFEEAHHAAKEGIAAARKRVIDAKKAFDEKIDAIKADVEMTRAAYKSRVAQVEQDFRIKEEECNLKRISLEREVISAESHANKLVADANTNLDQKELEMNQKVQEAKTSLADKEREGDQEIGGAIQTLQQKRVDLQNGFGNAIDAIRRAEERVNQEEWRVADADQRIAERHRALAAAPWYDEPGIWFHIRVLEAERAFLAFELFAARAILSGARFIVEGVAYKFALGVVDFAAGALERVRESWAVLIRAAQLVLDKIPEAFHHLIEAAKFAVLKAKELGMVAINLAKEAQAAWIAAEKQLLAIAREAIVAVANGVEKVAFDGAMIILDAVQKDTTLVDIAQAALDVAEKAEELAFAAAKWLTDKIATSLNIESIELVGTLRGSGGNQPGFTIMVKGVVLGHRIDFVGHWSPADTLTFLINLCAELWEMLKRNMLPSFTAGDVGETKRIEG